MYKEDTHKKLQSTLEFIVIVSFIAIVALSATILYIKNASSVRLANTDTLLAVAYFSGANGQYICNATEQESQCFEILLTQPLPKYPTYNLTYWNNEQQATNYAFEGEQDNYLLWINSPYSNQFYFPWDNSYSSLYGVALDNYGDVNYIGQVNGYYEYIVYAYPTVEKPAFVSSLELQYYSPNLFGNVTNTTYILPIDGNPIPVEMYLNATSLVNLLPEEPVQVPNFDNVLSVTEVGLTTGDSLLYSETFANGTKNSGSFPITSNSESTFVISNITNQLPETVTLNVSGEYPNGKTFGKESFSVSDNTNVLINFTPPAPIELISTTNTIGPFVVTANRNEPFSNLVITTGNTLANGGTIDDAYITNVTSNHVEFFIKNPAKVIYMNFNFSYNLNSSGPTGEAPTPVVGGNPQGPYAPYDDGAIVFTNYTNFITGTPSSGQFGTENVLEQNTTEQDVFTAGPFTFNANGNKLMNFTINSGLNISVANSTGNVGNLYLPIKSGETYILGAVYHPGAARNIGISNSTEGYYANDPVWTNGVFEREACLDVYLAYVYPESPTPNYPCGTTSTSFYYNAGQISTYSMYNLNGNIVTITFPDGTQNKAFSEILNGTSYYFTSENPYYIGEWYYLAETSQPVQMEVCQPPYSAPNTITCAT